MDRCMGHIPRRQIRHRGQRRRRRLRSRQRAKLVGCRPSRCAPRALHLRRSHQQRHRACGRHQGRRSNRRSQWPRDGLLVGLLLLEKGHRERLGFRSPCYEPWSDPVDRKAHGGVPFIEYYLQQFAAYEKAHGMRLLDYLDLHTYFAPDNLAFTTGAIRKPSRCA